MCSSQQCGRKSTGLDLLRAFGNVTASDGMSPEELKSCIGDYDALIIRSASKVLAVKLTLACQLAHHVALLSPLWEVVWEGIICLSDQLGHSASQNRCLNTAAELTGTAKRKLDHRVYWWQVTREIFEAAGGRLKVVGRAGVGVDNVDLGAATEVQLLFELSSPAGFAMCAT